MINSDIIRGHLDSVILKLINEQDMYGYQIASEIAKRTQDNFNIKEATLYSVVQRLEKKGLIESYVGEKTHGRTRKYYKMTKLGKAYYRECIMEWIELKQIMSTLLEDE